jgi:hypothetical protein
MSRVSRPLAGRVPTQHSGNTASVINIDRVATNQLIGPISPEGLEVLVDSKPARHGFQVLTAAFGGTPAIAEQIDVTSLSALRSSPRRSPRC